MASRTFITIESVYEPVRGHYHTAASEPFKTEATTSLLVLILLLAAADGLQFGEHGAAVGIVALLFGRLEFGVLACGLRRRKQRGAAILLIGRLLLGRAL